MTAAPSKLDGTTPAEVDSGIDHEDDSGSECSSGTNNSSSSEDEFLGPLSSYSAQSCIRVYGMIQRSKCGYCTTASGSNYLGAHAYRLTCDDYQALIDRGWRRSGTFMYLTNHKDSCCAYYTIRTHALDVSLSSSDKKLLRKWRKHQTTNLSLKHKCTTNSSSNSSASMVDDLVEKVVGCSKGVVELRLELASFSEEKFRLFEKYQRVIHSDLNSTRHGFKDFLCTSPLILQTVSVADNSQADPNEQEAVPLRQLGSYHQCYYIDGKLVAVGVIDILPKCVSSVYLFYDPAFSHLSLGSFSSLLEIALVRQLHRSVSSNIRYYYMGYYIPTCPKMTYKARWRPADLLDLITLKWIPIERCLERIREHPIFTTFDPEIDSLGLVRDQREEKLTFSPVLSLQAIQSVPGWDSADAERLKKALDMIKMWVFSPSPEHQDVSIPTSISMTRLMELNPHLLDFAYEIVAGLGEELATRMVTRL
ncbi:Arginyl-tRNA--protein transferase 1 [Coemansia sp. RSA 1813]|nr:Arginyl-tRNA--protein transferase 1 [Coemansia sp. RSA 1646]KAJ1771623.1 Arginyl-tRNA--protein transferase 1 [Coemansia sp. RSA 1843]KAJ2089925.1 Arginyl-tRNA--protein transferase 1 [Coemansia sp. RSA 986]KAJ2215241.1 Arginyl-tRNA--protein transferase 1 [Coemansia sp. RSA 487]KAJ2571004.1 Arginyl-tRNA--protein transferase 1 [Coemansia sp. RSA 1813]